MKQLTTIVFLSLLIVLASGIKICSLSKSSLKYEPWKLEDKEPFLGNVNVMTRAVEKMINKVFNQSPKNQGLPLSLFNNLFASGSLGQMIDVNEVLEKSYFSLFSPSQTRISYENYFYFRVLYEVEAGIINKGLHPVRTVASQNYPFKNLLNTIVQLFQYTNSETEFIFPKSRSGKPVEAVNENTLWDSLISEWIPELKLEKVPEKYIVDLKIFAKKLLNFYKDKKNNISYQNGQMLMFNFLFRLGRLINKNRS